jgi:predicted GNAT family N-acyltransferase
MYNFRDIIKIAESDEIKRRIYRFRYRIYIEEMGKPYQNADHQNKLLTDSLDQKCTLLYAEKNNKIIGTVRINWGADQETMNYFDNSDFALDRFRSFPDSRFSLNSRLMLSADFRNTLLGKNLAEASYRLGRERQIFFNFISCKPTLVSFFVRLGFRTYRNEFVDVNAGRQVPLVLLLEDENYLRETRSPFYQEAKLRSNNPSIGDWFRQEFSITTPFDLTTQTS